MKLEFARERILAIVAHPDDAELLCAGTLARAADEGAAIGIAVLCRGDRGQTDPPIEDLGEVRKAEMTKAAELLGAQLQFGEFSDGTLEDRSSNRACVIDMLRQFRPTLVFAHAPNDYHPDHRAASKLAEAASWFAASKGHASEHAPLPLPPPLWFMDTVGMNGFEPGFYIDICAHVEIKRRMLRFHESQMARSKDEGFSPLEPLMLQQCAARGEQASVGAAEAFRWADSWKRIRAF